MLLNALQVDPGRNWKGIWRWYDDYNIKEMTEQQLKEGMTLKEFNFLAKRNGARSIAFSPLDGSKISDSTIKKTTYSLFQNCLAASTKSNYLLMTLNFSRKALGQTGSGHFSPIAAYNSTKNLALVLDVAKFKYDSYWCPV